MNNLLQEKEIKAIDVVFENCDVIRIPKDYFMDLSLTGISKFKIEDEDEDEESQIFAEYLTAKHISFVIDAKVSTIKEEMDTFYGEKSSKLARLLQYNDITAIDVIYKDDTNDYILVDWNEDHEYINKHQSCKVNAITNNVFVVIDKTKTVHDVFKENEQ